MDYKQKSLRQKNRDKLFHRNQIAMGKRMYRCDDCKETMYIHPREFDRRAGVKCSYCGSRHVEAAEETTKQLKTLGHDYKILVGE